MENNTEQSINQQPPIQQVSQTNASGSKLRPVLLMILLLVIVGVGAYLLGTSKTETPPIIAQVSVSISPIPNPTANWKTYTNAQYGFEFKYPNSYSFKQKEPVAGEISALPENLKKFATFFIYNPDKTVKITVSVYNNLQYLPLDDWIKQVSEFGTQPSFINETKYAGSNNINFLRGIYGCCESFDLTAFASYQNRIIEIDDPIAFDEYIKYIHGDIKILSTEDIFNQILSTFKFTN